MRHYLKMLRQGKGLTQLETAKKLNVSESYYSMLENGERQKDMNLSLAEKLAEVFGVSLSQIVEEEARLKV